MYCVHLCASPPENPTVRDDFHWLAVANGQALMVHTNCHHCTQGGTRLPHVMSTGDVGATVASALALYDVAATDTLLQAMMKVAPHWPVAWP